NGYGGERGGGELDREHGAEGRAAGDSDQARVGEGVAEEALHGRAAEAEDGADEHGGEGAGKTDGEEDGLVERGETIGAAGEAEPERVERKARCAEGERGGEDEQQDGAEREDEGAAVPRAEEGAQDRGGGARRRNGSAVPLRGG